MLLVLVIKKKNEDHITCILTCHLTCTLVISLVPTLLFQSAQDVASREGLSSSSEPYNQSYSLPESKILTTQFSPT